MKTAILIAICITGTFADLGGFAEKAGSIGTDGTQYPLIAALMKAIFNVNAGRMALKKAGPEGSKTVATMVATDGNAKEIGKIDPKDGAAVIVATKYEAGNDAKSAYVGKVAAGQDGADAGGNLENAVDQVDTKNSGDLGVEKDRVKYTGDMIAEASEVASRNAGTLEAGQDGTNGRGDFQQKVDAVRADTKPVVNA